ncbi:MAG: hypothetical protein KGL12_05815 [Rhodospirillales bacterium]|nr:hypothetical protein [Rhodospirillales bacterium]
MKLAIPAMLLVSALAVGPAQAAPKVPNSIAALMGPTIGYLMSQSDLCGWNMTEQMSTTYDAGFKTIGLSAAQQASIWQVAKDRRAALNHLSAGAKAHMKAATCTAAAKARVEANLQ